MPEPARQLSGDRRDWVPIAEVAELTGLAESTWRWRALSLCETGKATKVPPESGIGRPGWHIHRTADSRLTYRRTEASDDATVRTLSGEHAERHALRAGKKLKYLRQYWSACRSAARGTSKIEVAERVVAEAKAAEGEKFKISVRSLQKWAKQYHAINTDTGSTCRVDGLVDRYGNAGANGRRDPEAVDFFYSIWHTEQRNSLRHCHEVTLRSAKRNGWQWAASESATRAWIEEHDDREFTLLMRDGPDAYAHRAMPNIPQDYSAVSPGEMYVCDHHQLKYFVSHRGKAIRPWLTAMLDCSTRIVVGWHLGIAPHSDSIMMALRTAFTVWGVSKIVKIDNGRDYTSKAFHGVTKRELRRYKKKFGGEWKDVIRRERDAIKPDECAWFGILPELGCEVCYARPYAGWSKHIERWFRTLTDRYSRTRPGFCDTSPHLKPSSLKAITADVKNLPSLDADAEAIGEYIDIYHAETHTGNGMNGMSPLQAWSAKPSVARIAPDGSLDLLCSARGLYKVGANGVTVTIGSTPVGYGQYSNKLRSHFGRKVLVSVDPANINEAVIMTADHDGSRRVICKVPRNKAVSPTASSTAQDMRDAQAERNRADKMKHRAAASSSTRTKTAAQIMDEDRSRQHRELRATGTHGKPNGHPDQTLRVIQTGIDASSTADRTPLEPAPPVADFSIDDVLDDAGSATPPTGDGLGFDFSEIVSDAECAGTDTHDMDVEETDGLLLDFVTDEPVAVDDCPSIEDLL